MFGHRPNSNQARICILGFSAKRVWLVSRFFYILLGSGRERLSGANVRGECSGKQISYTPYAAQCLSLRHKVCELT